MVSQNMRMAQRGHVCTTYRMPGIFGVGSKPTMTEEYLRIQAWTLKSLIWCFRRSPPSNTLGLGCLGCAVATVLFQIIQPLIIVVSSTSFPSGRRHTLNQFAAVAVGRKIRSIRKEAKIAATSLWIGSCRHYHRLRMVGIRDMRHSLRAPDAFS